MASNKGKASALGALPKSGGKLPSVLKKEGLDSDTRKLIHHVFGSPPAEASSSVDPQKELNLQNLPTFIDEALQDAVVKRGSARDFPETSHRFASFLGDHYADARVVHNAEQANRSSEGRLGPENVIFDTTGSAGVLVIDVDRVGVAGDSNFSTIRANTCVYKGKWEYELMLGSKGVMQVGWCTINCRFSQEEGVGDTQDSYAYDGNRLRKWNVKTLKYGEPWLTGDIISCAIDCDRGTVTFCRNGRSMGKAFSNIRLGSGMAYFPAVSLSYAENLRANFGATPLRYPIEGYRPLQDAPAVDLVKAQLLCDYLERLLPALVEEDRTCLDSKLAAAAASKEEGLGLTGERRSRKTTLMLLAAHLFDKLAPFLKIAYIVEACLFRFLLKFCDPHTRLSEQPFVSKTMDLIWGLLQDFELQPCLENLVVTLLTSYRFAPVTPEFDYQRMYLTLTLAILRHEDTRKYLLKNVLFDKVKFAIFMHVKPPDDMGLADIIPNVWWGFAKQEESSSDEDKADLQRKEQYLGACKQLGSKVTVLEEIQVEILKVLLTNKDRVKGVSSRFLFLQKFREFLKENSGMTRTRSTLTVQCPLPVSLCFLHRLIQALRYYWDEHATLHPNKAVPSSDAYVPLKKFVDDTIDYFETQRVGGLLSHLKKTYKAELQELGVSSRDASGHSDEETGSPPSQPSAAADMLGTFFNKISLSGALGSPKKDNTEAQDSTEDASANSLVEILDGIVMLYNMAGHKQLGKMCTLRDNLKEFVSALEDTEKKLKACPAELTEVASELERAKTVFIEKVSEQARHMAWVKAVIYAREKQEDIYWVLQVVLRTIEKASAHNNLFTFIPDFYVDVCLTSYNALKEYFHPTVPYDTLPDFQDTLLWFASFLSDHFADARIVHNDLKDGIVQAIACFVCYPMSLHALESIPIESQTNMAKSLISLYENRPWAQTNWILGRLWKGCGFGFRYTHLPHLLPAKTQQQEIGNASLQKPCPSYKFQALITKLLQEDPDHATKLIDSLLNQLNWAFSEFVGLLQELQQIANRPQASYIDNRQLKICATCFDISVGLLRVLEMIVNLTPEFFTDWSRPSAELLIARLFQLLGQVLNRVTARTSLFENVVSMALPGLETVDHFPILTAVTGILVRLVLKGDDKSRERSIAAVLAEPGFQISSLEFLLGGSGNEAAAAAASVSPTPEKKAFSFRNYKEVNEEEMAQMEELITCLRVQQNKAKAETPDIDEDSLCSICYARRKSAVFRPCGHISCKSCISHHLMNKKECFFCKVPIDEVVDLNGKPLPFH